MRRARFEGVWLRGLPPFLLKGCGLVLLRTVVTGPGGSGDFSFQMKPPARKPKDGGSAAPEVSLPTELFGCNSAEAGHDASPAT